MGRRRPGKPSCGEGHKLAVYLQRSGSKRISTTALFNNRSKHSGRALQVGSFDRFGKLLHASEIGKRSVAKLLVPQLFWNM